MACCLQCVKPYAPEAFNSSTQRSCKGSGEDFHNRHKENMKKMDTLGIEPRASRMLSGCDTTTPCAQLQRDSELGADG